MGNHALVYGVHAVRSLLNQPKASLHALWIQKGPSAQRLNELIELAEQLKLPVYLRSSSELSQQFGEIVHQGVLLTFTPPPALQESDLPALLDQLSHPPFILVLDGVTDPHNLGACLRTADAAGVDVVLIPKDKSASLTPTVHKVASGAADSVKLIRVTNLVRTLTQLKDRGIWIYGAAGEATQPHWSIDFKGPCALVMGAEGHGLRRLTRTHCDALFSLPMKGQVESLNVSVATGICLYEVVKQRS